MGDLVEGARRRAGNNSPTVYIANIAVTAACLFDYFVQGRPWALETLAILVVLINGFALMDRRSTEREAVQREEENAAEEIRASIAREKRWRDYERRVQAAREKKR